MKRGPSATEIGTASCPLCHRDMMIKTNKHGYPAAWCDHCETQFQTRSATGSLLLMGRIHTWTDGDAAAALIEPEDQGALQPQATAKPSRLPPHLTLPPAPPPRPAELREAEKVTRDRKKPSIWDRKIV